MEFIDKKEIQKKRIMSYFIEAANKIIDEEGIEEVTIRKVGDLAGYNSATLYNYFENLDHLIFFACMKYMREYVLSLPENIETKKDSIEKYLCVWKAFSTHSFRKPKIYYKLFFDRFSNNLNDSIKQYYDIFPEELGKQSTDLLPMLLGQNIYDRNLSILKNYLPKNTLADGEIAEINEMHILIYQGMLMRFLNGQVEYSVDEAVNKILVYAKRALDSYLDI